MVHGFLSIGGRPKSGSQLLGAAWGHGHITKCVQNHKPKTRIRCGSRDCRGPRCIFSRVQAFWPCLFFQAVACRYACKSFYFTTWQTSTLHRHKMIIAVFFSLYLLSCVNWSDIIWEFQVFDFADRYRGSYSDSLSSVVCPFYCSYSGYHVQFFNLTLAYFRKLENWEG